MDMASTHSSTFRDDLYEFLTSNRNYETPELTEVSLASLLADEGIPYELATYDDLYTGDSDFSAKLKKCEVVFASSTFVRDLSELIPLIHRLKRRDNRIVVGGALMGSIHGEWQGHESVDVVAAQVGGEVELVRLRRQQRDEDVVEAAAEALHRVFLGEVVAPRLAHDEDVALGVHADPVPAVVVAAREQGRPKDVADRVELHHEGVSAKREAARATDELGSDRSRSTREVRGRRLAGQPRSAGRVDLVLST